MNFAKPKLFAKPKPETNSVLQPENKIWQPRPSFSSSFEGFSLVVVKCVVQRGKDWFNTKNLTQSFLLMGSTVVNSAAKEPQWNSWFHLWSPEWKKEETPAFFLYCTCKNGKLCELRLYPRRDRNPYI